MAQGIARLPARDTSSATEAQLRFAASVVVGAVAVAGVYFARPILVPLALAILLAFALAPVVSLLRRVRVGHVFSVLLATLFAMSVIGVLVLFIGTQLAHLAADLPRDQQNIAGKIHALQTSASTNGAIARASSMFEKLNREISTTPHGSVTAIGTRTASVEHPLPVEIRRTDSSPLEIIESVFLPLLNPLATAGIAIIFVVFILLQKEDLRDRFIWLAGTSDLRRAKLALDDGAARVSLFLLTQTAINMVFGASIGAGLWLIGVPNRWLWGLVTAMMRFVPYVGVPLAAMLPLTLSFAVDPGWSMMLRTAGLYLLLELITGQAIEPTLYGRSVGLSPVAVVVAATFWTWVWGPVGLLLSTPLTLCLAVLGRHVERLRFLDVLLGNVPPLAHEESLYLSVLAEDPDDAARLAEIFLKQHSLCDYYDIALKALILAQADVNRGVLDAQRCAGIKSLIEGLIENLSDHVESTEPSKTFAPQSLPEIWRGRPVLCVAGRNILDEAASLLLVHLLERRGIGARVASAGEASSANVQRLDPSGVQFICLSYLEAGSDTNAHYLMRRLRRRIPAARAMTGFWGLVDDNGRYLDAIAATGCDVVTKLCEAVERVVQAVEQSSTQTADQAPDAKAEDRDEPTGLVRAIA